MGNRLLRCGRVSQGGDVSRQPEHLFTDTVVAPGGHYSQGIAWEDLIFVSGQLPVASDGQHLNNAGFEAQVRQALLNVLTIVRAAGSNPAHILKVTAYIAGAEHWADFNKIYAQIFAAARPARTVVPVMQLHHGFLIEVEAIAVRERPVRGTTGYVGS
jgi:2-iminobutanoate/2-iminopropanoate deaminase